MTQVENVALKVAQVYIERDKEQFKVITDQIDNLIAQPDWLLRSENYGRSDDNELRLTFSLGQIIRGMVTEGEKQWPSATVKNMVYDYYTDRGFDVFINSSDDLTLKIGPDIMNGDKTEEVISGEATA